MNLSKVMSPRQWKIWTSAGAVAGVAQLQLKVDAMLYYAHEWDLKYALAHGTDLIFGEEYDSEWCTNDDGTMGSQYSDEPSVHRIYVINHDLLPLIREHQSELEWHENGQASGFQIFSPRYSLHDELIRSLARFGDVEDLLMEKMVYCRSRPFAQNAH